MDPSKAEVAKRVFAVCRRAISPFLAAPSKCSKVFQAISKAHTEWDEKNLKIHPKPAPAVVLSDDDTQQPETPTKLPKRGARQKRNKEDDDDTDPSYKRKKAHNASEASGTSTAELDELKVRTLLL